jgi:hypothetical protein
MGEVWLLGEMQVWGDGMVAVASESTSVLGEIWSLKLLTISDGCSVVGVVDPVLLFSGAAPVKCSYKHYMNDVDTTLTLPYIQYYHINYISTL